MTASFQQRIAAANDIGTLAAVYREILAAYGLTPEDAMCWLEASGEAAGQHDEVSQLLAQAACRYGLIVCLGE